MLSKFIRLRESLRPYVRVQMKKAHEDGTPVMRPLFFDFPKDPKAWEEESAYMFGPDMLVAPVLTPGVNTRDVYLPQGVTWVEQATGKEYEGGQSVHAFAPLHTIPVFTLKESGIQLKELHG